MLFKNKTRFIIVLSSPSPLNRINLLLKSCCSSLIKAFSYPFIISSLIWISISLFIKFIINWCLFKFLFSLNITSIFSFIFFAHVICFSIISILLLFDSSSIINLKFSFWLSIISDFNPSLNDFDFKASSLLNFNFISFLLLSTLISFNFLFKIFISSCISSIRVLRFSDILYFELSLISEVSSIFNILFSKVDIVSFNCSIKALYSFSVLFMLIKSLCSCTWVDKSITLFCNSSFSLVKSSISAFCNLIVLFNSPISDVNLSNWDSFSYTILSTFLRIFSYSSVLFFIKFS